VANGIAINHFITTGTIKGVCTARIYVYDPGLWNTCRPVIYTEHDSYPGNRITKNGGAVSCVSDTKWWTWKETTFEIDGTIPGNTPFWFGIAADRCNPVFDFGGDHYVGYPDSFDITAIPAVFPANHWKYYSGEIKMSFYFDFISAQNYVCTLTQGITLTDSRKLTWNYKRSTTKTGFIYEKRAILGCFDHFSSQFIVVW
jgi:hypothetical protein